MNYAARACDVQRGDNIQEAKRKCPQIHLPHVGTMGTGAPDRIDRQCQKATLKRYRDASRKVFDIIDTCVAEQATAAGLASGSSLQHRQIWIEKASIDEAYIDVTAFVSSIVDRCSTNGDLELPERTRLMMMRKEKEDAPEPLTTLGSSLRDRHRRLCLGAIIGHEIRTRVAKACGYTLSVGIARNKLLAKLASPMNKPDGQMILPHESFLNDLGEVPITALQGLGGKLGLEIMKACDVSKLRDLRSLGTSALQQRLPHLDRGTCDWIVSRSHGLDAGEIDGQKHVRKSILSAKNFQLPGLASMHELGYWLALLCEELLDRMDEEIREHDRMASKLVLSYMTLIIPGANAPDLHVGNPGHQAKAKKSNLRSKTMAMPSVVSGSLSKDQNLNHRPAVRKEKLVKIIASQLSSFVVFPCVNLSLTAKDFISRGCAAGGGGEKSNALSKFFPLVENYTEKNQQAFEQYAENHSMPSVALAPASVTIASAENIGPTLKPQTALPQPMASSYFCSQCNRYIHRKTESEVQHQDYHVAKRLESQWSSSGTSSMQQMKKKKRSGGPMDQFLMKKSK